MTDQTQYVLDFPVLQSLSGADFVVGGCNRVAADAIRLWPKWPGHAFLIVGESGSGKTHLAAIWAERAGANVVSGAALKADAVPNLGRCVLVENADEVLDEGALLHLYNWVKGQNGSLLMTAKRAAREWEIDLPDLISRLKSVPVASLGKPDETILSAAMAKQFSDRQILVDDAVISYLMKRMERSFEAVQTVVEKIDTLSLREKSKVTIPLARKVLERR